MIFVFDLDDTVCDTDGYSEAYILDFFRKYEMPYKKVYSVARFAEKKFDWDMDVALKWYKMFGDQMMLEFPGKPNAIETINWLYDNGHKIIIATARATDWHASPVDITTQWLEEKKLKYHKLYMGRVDKEQICADENADVFVDDDIKITSRVKEHNPNMMVFLASTDYNNQFSVSGEITRVDNLKTMVSIALNEEENEG